MKGAQLEPELHETEHRHRRQAEEHGLPLQHHGGAVMSVCASRSHDLLLARRLEHATGSPTGIVAVVPSCAWGPHKIREWPEDSGVI